jgi:uncharacterized protein (TIGR03435 family)
MNMPAVRMIIASSFLLAGVCLADGPTFDAASVKLSDPDARPPFGFSGGPGSNDPGRFRANHVRMSALLMRAFGVSSDQIAGPAWLRDFSGKVFYDIAATIPPKATQGQFRQMLQNLLIERFHLAAHHESRNFPGYALVIDNGRAKLQEVTADPNATVDPLAVVDAKKGPDGFPAVPGSRVISQGSGGRERVKYQERTMAEFVSNLGYLIGMAQGRPASEGFPQPRVIDKTGLAGKYTFILEYYSAGDADRAAAAPDSPTSASNSPGPEFPDIFAALRKQLGLRLDKLPDVPTDVILIERLDKVPTEN